MTYDAALALARAGDLDFADVRTTEQACAARVGYAERGADETLSLDERRFANDFVANLDCDFG